MSKLPLLSAKEVIKALTKVGYEFDHQRGSHIVLRRREPPHRRIAVPNFKELPRGTLRAIINEAGLTPEQLLKLLD
ncbi:MAG: type II toxin-antitoxin system HicA family toxin [Nitrososphaerota archaeon]|nr:type II toxin-antitoxin system HicA family toxin [Nitrososphaerota archaeon]MDG6924080.1 type II toxin-antitoxin system HicA family toxin [Nitrososphaerota archaeon]